MEIEGEELDILTLAQQASIDQKQKVIDFYTQWQKNHASDSDPKAHSDELHRQLKAILTNS